MLWNRRVGVFTDTKNTSADGASTSHSQVVAKTCYDKGIEYKYTIDDVYSYNVVAVAVAALVVVAVVVVDRY